MRETTLCYLSKNDCYLMLYRVKKKNDANHDKWIGVGGGMLDGETPKECAIREVWEETGYTMHSPVYRGIVNFYSTDYEDEVMHIFTSNQFSGEQIDCDEGALAWVPISQVPNLPGWEGDRIFLTLLATDAPFFHLSLYYEKDNLVKAILNKEELSLPFEQ